MRGEDRREEAGEVRRKWRRGRRRTHFGYQLRRGQLRNDDIAKLSEHIQIERHHTEEILLEVVQKPVER